MGAVFIGAHESSQGAAQPVRAGPALLKPRHSAFYGSPLELLLKETGTRELILAGIAADICVQLTAADAFLRGFEKVWVPSDCTAAETAKAKANALASMRDVLQCDVRSSRARRSR